MREAVLLAEAYYRLEGNSVGGSLHLVLEDRNLDVKCVRFCIEEAKRRDDQPGEHLASMLLAMSGTQRRCVWRLMRRP